MADTPKVRVFRDLGGLAGWCRALLFVQAAVSTLAVILALLSGPPSDGVVDGPLALVGLLQVLVFVAGGVIVLRWIALANINSHALGAQNLSTGPFMAVAAYFIPIANLFMPAQSMAQIWKASLKPRDWETVKTPAVLGFWWAAWLIGNMLGTVAFRLSLEDYVPDGAAVTHWLTFASDLLTVVASLLLAILIGRITTQQRATHSPSISAPPQP